MPKYFKQLNFLVKKSKVIFSLQTNRIEINIHWQQKESSSELVFQIVRFSD